MLYYLVRPVARFVLRHYYRHIDITGLENIPRGAPVILAANHPTAFIEPCLLACFQHRALHFLARGDLYKNPLATAVLRALNILPVFRIQDGGYGKLKHNFTTFAACHRVLSNRGAVMILAEGRCVHEKALRPLRKGTARIAMGALDADATLQEVYIIPVGVNFTHADRVRSTVMIRCGQPIMASDYLDDYRRQPAVALQNLTSHLRRRLSPLVVQFPTPEVATGGEVCLEVDRAIHRADAQRGVTHDGRQLERELFIAATVAATAKSAELGAELAHHRISATMAANITESGENLGMVHFVAAVIAVAIQLPLLPIYGLAQWIAATRPATVEFYSPVRFAAVAVGLTVVIPLIVLFAHWLVIAWVALALISTGWCIRRVEVFHHLWQLRRWSRMVPRTKQRLRSLLGDVADECSPR